jgi:hypothetical protein
LAEVRGRSQRARVKSGEQRAESGEIRAEKVARRHFVQILAKEEFLPFTF